MPAIKWSPELSMGVPEIDEQHKRLIKIANALINAVAKGSDKRIIENVVRRLREYTVFHFNSEEKLMEDIHYRNRGEHALEHARLKDQVKKYQRSIYKKENLKPDAVLNFLKVWLLKHILDSDRQLADFIHEKEKKD